MTADASSAANGDTTNPKTLANIPEEPHDEDTVNAEEMDTADDELNENSNLKKSHIIVRFIGDGKQINVAFLLKAVFTWLFEIDPDMYLETINPEWQFINSMYDFPTKEVEFRKCFDPTANRVGGSSSVAIGVHLFSTVSIGLMKKHNSPFMQYLKSKKISIKTSCGGSKNEAIVCGLLGINPDKTQRASITQQLHAQLVATVPDLAERKLLEKAKQVLPFPGIVPDFELQARWINADKKKYSAKAFSIVCAAEHADFLRSLIVRAYFEGHVIGIGKLVQLGGRHSAYLPKAITWHNKFVEDGAILNLKNISKNAMDQCFTRKTTASTEETTTIRRILLSSKEGKATNIYESRDVADGRWIIGIDSDKVENLVVLVATVISKLYENGQILHSNHSAEAPFIDRPKPRRKSNESEVSGFDDDDTSIQSMHSKSWSSVAMTDTGSVPKYSTNKSKPRIQFVYDPESTEEFPALPTNATTANSPRNDNSSVGSSSSITKSEFDTFQTKLHKDLAEHLKACQSTASSMTGDSTVSQAIEEMRAERLAMRQANEESLKQQHNQMAMFMQQFQQMMGLFMSRDNQNQQQQNQYQSPNRHQYHHQQNQHHNQQQQQQYQQQQQQYHANQQLAQQPHHQQQLQQQPHSPQQSQPTASPSRQLFSQTPPQQQLECHPEQHQRPDNRTFKRPQGPGGYLDPNNPSALQHPPHQRPATMPPDGAGIFYPQQQQQYRNPEEQIVFDYQGTPHRIQIPDEQMLEQPLKSAPGGAGKTDMSPLKKKGTNATTEYYADAPPRATPENSPSESAGGVQ